MGECDFAGEEEVEMCRVIMRTFQGCLGLAGGDIALHLFVHETLV